ncbi:hypothetical protein Alches_05620 [Alicyclobacillus hesperidum subsp. aegles]|uniref:glycosyltransferase n=1 Tax=Alicyclobacillus hesperidum TaxID=89784 RepID=UPI000316E6D8|nr:glycosyltransferase [Alicyclobacillus hesperidum]GLG00523.1 hypothetical protein Alches_05620 [Alicyclobacillus hesperidum subsp. aegles]
MRVLMVLDEWNLGGTETHVLSIAKMLLRKHVNVLVAAADGPLLPRVRALQIPNVCLPKPAWSTLTALADSYRQETLAILRDVMTTQQIDLVHAHQLPTGLVALAAAQEHGVPFLYTVHGTYEDPEKLQIVLRGASGVVAVSPPLETQLRNWGYKSVVIPNGVDLSEFHPADDVSLRNRLGLSNEAFVWLYTGRMAWEKAKIAKTFVLSATGVHKAYRDVHALVVGNGARRAELEHFVAKWNGRRRMPWVHVLGGSDNMNCVYNVANAVVGTGRVALEAMAAGKPVVAVGSHGFVGLVEPKTFDLAWHMYFGDHDAVLPVTRSVLTRTMSQVTAMREVLPALGDTCRRWVAERFAIEKVCEPLLALYERVGGGPTR